MASTKPCRRCKAVSAPYDLRNDPTCSDCFIEYVEAKGGRRLGAVARDTRAPGRPGPRRYLGGLSFGHSSTVMTQILDISARFHSSKKSSPAFEPLVVHIDTDLTHLTDGDHQSPAQRLLAKYRERFPNVSFECIHLSKIWSVKTLDWSALTEDIHLADEASGDSSCNDSERLRKFFDSLPSMTSKTDILRLFVRHLLLDLALERDYTALLLGHSTSALAALTLAEVANGRGFAVPWQINDGPYTVCTYNGSRGDSQASQPQTMPIYYPMREVFKNEVTTYLDLVPSVKELMPQDSSSTSNIVSHKDLSIAEVMERYFDSVEGPYSGIVANVVRTTGKLEKATGGGFCHLCGMTLDVQGDSRWAGELGDDDGNPEGASPAAHLCYGCKRSMNG